MKILITGASGFIGKNLCLRLQELDHQVLPFCREDSVDFFLQLVKESDAVIHLAGENRPTDVSHFDTINRGLTESICHAIRVSGKKVPLVFASSIQATQDNPYGKSKLAAEQCVAKLCADTNNSGVIFRLPNVFGKWCKPNYNSVVATFCHNIAHNMPIHVSDENRLLSLVYIDDVVNTFVEIVSGVLPEGLTKAEVVPNYQTTLGELSTQIQAFKDCKDNLVIEKVGVGLIRALYATYVSYLPTTQFSYPVAAHADERGVFVEMLKTKDSGQFSFFTAKPGVTRGEHYHHTKTEKFLVMKGQACFSFRHMITDEKFELLTSSDVPTVVDTVPGWTHDITNIGDEEMIVMLWANEIFDREKPDTIGAKV